MKRYWINSKGDTDEIAHRLRALGPEVGASLKLGGEMRELRVNNDSTEAHARVTAVLEAAGSRIIAELVPDCPAIQQLEEEARTADDATPDGPTLH